MENEHIFYAKQITTLKTYPEVMRAYNYSHPKYWIRLLIILATTVYFILYLSVWKVPFSWLDYVLWVYVGYMFVRIIVQLLRDRKGGVPYQRLLLDYPDGIPNRTISFTEEHITLATEGKDLTHTVQYNTILSAVRSKNYIIIKMLLEQYLFFDTSTLEGGTPEEFIRFLTKKSSRINKPRYRSTLPGKIFMGILVAAFAVMSILLILHIPFVQTLVTHSRPIHDDMSAQEIADVLEDYGIYADDESIRLCEESAKQAEIALDGESYLPDGYKVTTLLVYTGFGTYDDTTWEWIPGSGGVYWFDTEGVLLDTMYSDFLRGISALDPHSLDFTNIREDISDVDWKNGSGKQRVTFEWNGMSYCLEADVNYDWFDLQVAEELNKIIRTQTNDCQLYFTSDNSQGVLVFYRTEKWVNKFEKASGLNLESSIMNIAPDY